MTMFQMLVTYANNSAVITETVPNTISRDAQVSLKSAKSLALSFIFLIFLYFQILTFLIFISLPTVECFLTSLVF